MRTTAQYLKCGILGLMCAIALSTSAQTNTPPATNWVVQVLEPTGGKIHRPKEWFYTEGHRESAFMWTISREDSTKGPYTTGVRIQMFAGVKEKTGKTPKQFVQEFLEQKKREAGKVVKACPESKQDMFTRVCIETEEGPHRIMYSLFHGNNDLDLVVVSIAGTKKELWETYSPSFNRMSDFELIDMKRFEQK